jgi:uncharacterized protein
MAAINLSTPYSQNFDTLPNSGTNTWTDDSTLAGWYIARLSGTGTNAINLIADNGGSNTGSIYSYGATGTSDRALGSIASGATVPGFGVRFVNNTGSTITTLNISYTGEQWRSSTTDQNTLDFSYQIGATGLTTGTWIDFNTLDLAGAPPVSTNGALDGNLPANQTSKSGALTGLNLLAGQEIWLRWNDTNDGGNDAGLAIDNLQVSTTGITPTPGVTITQSNGSTTVTEGGATDSYTVVLNTQPTANVTITLAPDAQTTVSTPTLTFTSANWNVAQTVTVTAVDDVAVEGLHSSTITQTVASADAAYNGIVIPPLSVTVVDNDGTTSNITKINQIQGTGTTFNPAFGGTRTIEGIVVSAFLGTTRLNGFYVQEEDADWDNDAATSEGIFVFDPTGLFSGNVGDKVQITGLVSEFTSTATNIANQPGNSSLTQLSLASTVTNRNVTNLGSGNTLPTVTNITLPVVDESILERYEGMLVNITAATGPLTVTNTFTLGRFGQVGLSAGGRLNQFTQVNAPSVSGNTNYLNNLLDNYIILDDGNTNQNPDPEIFARGGNPLSASNTLRAGDTVASITGVLDERFEGYRVQTTVSPNFQATNPRPTTAPVVGGTLRVANANVLNYFTDLDTNVTITIPNGVSFEPRGANTATEFQRQQDKLVAELLALNADVIGVQEIENDGPKSLQTLVNALNAVAGAGTYAFINDTTLINDPNPQINAVGTDAIKVGILYKPSKVTPMGLAQTYQEPNPANPIFSRPPVAQTFMDTNGEKFTVIVNHFKSKSSTGATGADLDQNDGQGAFNATRVAQSNALLSFINTMKTVSGDNDVLVIGDLNAYAKETPITTLTNGGLTNLFDPSAYSFQFNGQWGSLDYSLASGSLAAQVTGTGVYHNNSDEPVVLDYNTEFKSVGQVTSFYAPDQYRASDHDPLVIGLDLGNIINGTPGRDNIIGTAGRDRITGGFGADNLTGGGGNDDFIYTNVRDAGDTITDFTVGADKLVLTQLFKSLNLNLTYATAVSGGYLGFSAQGNNTVLTLDVDGATGPGRAAAFITLQNVSVASLNTANNFVV